MADLPIAVPLAQLRTSAGARLPADITALIASYAPRSLAFGSLSYPFGRLVRNPLGGFYAPVPNRDEVVSYDEMRQRIYRYIVEGETVGGHDAIDNNPAWRGDHFEVIVEYGIKLVMFLGLDDQVVLRSIFLPPISSYNCRRRMLFLCMDLGLCLSSISYEWRNAHGVTPEFIEWRAEVSAWDALWMGDHS
jgi:hypothetical protein